MHFYSHIQINTVMFYREKKKADSSWEINNLIITERKLQEKILRDGYVSF